MKLTIAERMHPFSHLNGTKFLLPQTSLCIQVFPTRLEFIDLEGDAFFLTLDFAGPIHDFTAELDLEQGVLRVFGMTQKGHMRYCLFARKDGIQLKLEKAPEEKVVCHLSTATAPFYLTKGESLLIPMLLREAGMEKFTERLSLGGNKAQNWDLVRRRCDFTEIFPIWLALSHWIPAKTVETTEGNYSLLEMCRKNIEEKNKEKIVEGFHHLFLAAFEGVLVPRSVDTEHQGILNKEVNRGIPALPLLTKGASLIRSLFVGDTSKKVAILPCLPPQFHSGRMVGVQVENAVLDFEWSKKSLRCLQIVSSSDAEICLILPKGIRSCRLKLGRKESKKTAIGTDGSLILSLAPAKPVCLDRFER